MPPAGAEPPSRQAAPLSLYAVTQPGLESITWAELVGLGITPDGRESGGISFTGSARDLARCNLHLRSASRILMRVAEFPVRALGELERKAGQLTWDAWIPRDRPVAFRVTSKKSRLYHQRAVAERLARAAGVEQSVSAAPNGGEEKDLPEPGPETESGSQQLVVVRLYRDICSISIDSSGEHLHRRGYRLASAKAPLRETLAAALLLASEWETSRPLVDPFAGSGTIAIEAALLARRIPPGLSREFSFWHWPGWNQEIWKQALAEARGAVLDRAPAPILAADRDAGAVEAASQNAERAGVEEDIEHRRASISELEPPSGAGVLVSNPPWGLRIGEQRALRDLYARLGQILAARFSGWQATLLLPQTPLERATGLGWDTLARTTHGGVAVRMVRWPQR